MIDDENTFINLRVKLLGEPTSRQSQVVLSVATVDIDNEKQADNQIHKIATSATTNKAKIN